MDKASILGDAIKHMKELQDKVKILEEQTKKQTMESVVLVKKCELNQSPSKENISDEPITLPQVEAKFRNNDVLINLHCERRKGILEKALSEVEKLNLLVVNSSVMSFGNSSLHITVISQVYTKVKFSVFESAKFIEL